MSDEEEALWEGQFMDVNGRQGSVSVMFSSKRNLAGLTMLVFEPDTSPTAVPWDAPLEGQSPKTRIKLTRSENLPGGGKRNWELDLTPADPDAFARAALVGGYKATTEGSDARFLLSSGVMIIWLFEHQSRAPMDR